MTEGTALSSDAGFCTGGEVVEISVEVIGVLAEVVVLVLAIGAVLRVTTGSSSAELVVGPAEVAAATVSVLEGVLPLGAGSACTWTVCCPTWCTEFCVDVSGALVVCTVVS